MDGPNEGPIAIEIGRSVSKSPVECLRAVFGREVNASSIHRGLGTARVGGAGLMPDSAAGKFAPANRPLVRLLELVLENRAALLEEWEQKVCG